MPGIKIGERLGTATPEGELPTGVGGWAGERFGHERAEHRLGRCPGQPAGPLDFGTTGDEPRESIPVKPRKSS